MESQVQERTGSVRILGGVKGETLHIHITTKTGAREYLLRETEDGYQLDRMDSPFEEPYIVSYRMDHCTCPDYFHRRVLCKHCKAVAALWNAAKIN